MTLESPGFHIHVADRGGFCLVCGHASRPEYQSQLEDVDPEYDDPVLYYKVHHRLLRVWGYPQRLIKEMLGSRPRGPAFILGRVVEHY